MRTSDKKTNAAVKADLSFNNSLQLGGCVWQAARLMAAGA
jgi:hypothetical protein